MADQGQRPSPLYAAAAEMAGAVAELMGGRKEQSREFLVDNSELESSARGLAYRLSQRQEDKDPGELAEWGSIVTGVNEGNGWVRVGSRYLPFNLDGARVLMPLPTGPDASAPLAIGEGRPVDDIAEWQMDALREVKPFEGMVVEIQGMAGLARNLEAAAEAAEEEEEEIDVDGQRGVCVGWLAKEQMYAVKTFEGWLVAVPEENVQAWTPPAAENGGFDVPWVDGARGEDLAAAVAEHLLAKGYCLIQTSLSTREREAALEAAEEGRAFQRMKQELESGYLGYDNHTKVAPLAPEGAAGAASDEEAAAQEGPQAVLQACNQQMIDLGLVLRPWAPAQLGFLCHGLMNTMVRTSIDKSEEDELYPESIRDDDDPAEWSGLVEAYVRFAQRRKLCMINMIDNGGGDLWLYPKEELDLPSVHIPIAPNRLLIFRHDMMEYSYQVEGPSVALQTWVLDSPVKEVQINAMQIHFGVAGAPGEVVANPGPVVSDAPTASVMALSNRMSGACWSPDHWWNMFIGGTDCDVKWPQSRWMTEPYYDPGDPLLTGKSYTCHGGFLSQEQIGHFDNKYFDIGEVEAKSMIPGQRLVLEVGYACLFKTGARRESLRGSRIGAWVGDVGPDWNSFQADWGRFFAEDDKIPNSMYATSMSCICTAGRISHIFDMKGPVSSYDTACSSSLIALNAAHSAMFRARDAGQAPGARGLNPAGRAGEDCTEALVGGVNTLLGPGSFIGNCMANMLTHKGRCFTFTDSADGYQRADACGFVFIKLFDGDRDQAEHRICSLTGTCANADGRSASLTAPSGPAQQKLLRKSIAFSNIDPTTVSFAECHGTGTSLGDPIECGAIAAVVCPNREFPLLMGSHKSNTGHSEAGAGISGLTKCILFLGMQAAPPNCHFNTLNPNIATEGFPMYFASEAIDTGFSDCFCGVSSFGFGGSNARADVSGHAWRGHREALRMELPRLNMPREIPIGQPLYICGSWTGWSEYEPMEGGRDGVYTCCVPLGPTGREEFHLSCGPDGGDSAIIHPLVPRAGRASQIVGPDSAGHDLNWFIDGASDGARPGAVYRIEFTWAEEKKRISWSPVDVSGEASEDLAVLGKEFEHRFFLAGTWLRSEEMQAMTLLEDGGYRASFPLGVRSEEEFHIVLDRNKKQQVYPSSSRAVKPGEVYGPDALRGNRSWLVRGPVYQAVEVTLYIKEGQLSVTVTSPSLGSRTWSN